MTALILGIEIGGTKLQLGVGDGIMPAFNELVRLDIDRSRGAAGILGQIEAATRELQSRHKLEAVGFGFGGPVDRVTGSTLASHQVEGWTNYPLVNWMTERNGLPAAIGNDCDVAALAEATFGAGRGYRTVFYVTVGTGIGGGLVINGKSHGVDRLAAAEIGHLRPGLDCTASDQTVEAIASGLGMERQAIRLAATDFPGTQALANACGGDLKNITGQLLANAAENRNELATHVIGNATRALGWAIAQTTTLIAPDIVVVGGGVSMMPEHLFFAPLQEAIQAYSFGPLKGSFRIEPPTLSEDVVVHGAIANARQTLFDS